MRRLIIPLLMANVMAPIPALARDGRFGDGNRSGAEQGQRDDSDSHPQRAQKGVAGSRTDRPARVQRMEPAERQSVAEPHVERVDRAPRLERQDERVVREVRTERQVERAKPVQQTIRDDQPASIDRVVRVNQTDNAIVEGLRSEAREQQAERNVNVHNGDRDHRRGKWSGDWRKDHRYDWSHHRSRYGSLYRLGRYYDPYGYRHRHFSIGYNLWPSYYGSNFWLDDPWMYRLPPAYGPYRWVRYYDDAVLVNIYTGMVVDVVYNFFW